MAIRPDDLYERDFYAWTRGQAAALRKLKAERWNGPLDLAHLAEEVEDLGKSERNAVRSQLERVIEHLLKLEHSSHTEPRAGWMNLVDDARARIADSMTPVIRAEIEPALDVLYHRAVRRAERSLADHGEAESAAALPGECPYPLDDLVNENWWPANRHGLANG